MHRIGLVSVSFRPYSPQDVLQFAAAAGLSCIEWGSDIHAPASDTARLRQIAAMQTAQVITCSSYGTYFRLGLTPLDTLPTYIHAAKLLGTDILRLWCGVKASAAYTEDELASLTELCRCAAEIAQAHQVKLCMECHNGTLTDNVDAAIALLDKVHSPAFRMYWQPNQFKSFAENCDYAARIAPYTEHLHVFHWQGKDRYPLDEGRALWQSYLSYFGADNTLLLEFMPDDRPESLPREAEALRKILQQD